MILASARGEWYTERKKEVTAVERKTSAAPGAEPQVHHKGVMDNGMVEICYRDPSGNEMRVYGHSGKRPKQKGLFSWLRFGKKDRG